MTADAMVNETLLQVWKESWREDGFGAFNLPVHDKERHHVPRQSWHGVTCMYTSDLKFTLPDNCIDIRVLLYYVL